jgi:hypothetical protein
MEQVNEVQLCLKSVNLSMNMPCECSLIYQLTGKKTKMYHTDVSKNTVSPFWQNLDPIWISCSLRELLQESIVIQVVRKVPNQFNLIEIATCQVPLYHVVSLVNKQTLLFNGPLIYNSITVGSLSCLVESNNVPIFAQLENGKYVGDAIIGGVVLFNGVQIPTIPRFTTEIEAQHYRKQQKEKKLLERQEQVPRFDPSKFRDTQSPIHQLTQLISQTNFLMLSNDRLSVSFEDSSVISMPSCVKSSSSVFDLENQYFEVTILNSGSQDLITIGLAPQTFHFHSQPGSNGVSYGYESKSGNKYHAGQYSLYGPAFTTEDTIGCGISPEGAVYFTKNGEFLGLAFYPITTKIATKDLFCIVALHSNQAKVRVNFGNEKFKFNLANAKLPSGWNLNETVDKFGRFFFVSEDGARTFVDPRIKPAKWKEHISIAERLCNTLAKPLQIKYSEYGNLNNLNKHVIWTGIKSERVVNALRMIPRIAFVPDELIDTIAIGQHISTTVNGILFDLTSVMVASRALDELKLSLGSKFLEIGSGCGYVTALAGFIVGDKGVACGVDINMDIIEFSKMKLLEFSKQTGIFLNSVTFAKKNVFNSSSNRSHNFSIDNSVIGPPVIQAIHTPVIDKYDAIFCGLEIQRNQLKDLQAILMKGGSIVTCIDGILKKLSLDQNSEWKEVSLMKIPNGTMSKALLPTEKEERIEKIETLKEGLLKMGFNISKIEAGMKYLGFDAVDNSYINIDDTQKQQKLLNYCYLAQHPLVNHHFSEEEIFDAMESFPSPFPAAGNPQALLYLSNAKSFAQNYQLPIRKVKEAFQFMRCNLELVQRFLSDATYCRDQILRSNNKRQMNAIDEDELIQEIFNGLMTYSNVELAMTQLKKKYT